MRGGIEPSVCQIFSFSCEINQGYQPIEPPLDGEVNMRLPDVAFSCRITTRFDGTKAVAPRSVSREACKALEIGVKRCRVGVARMAIFSRSIGLPNVDARMRHRLTRTGEHASHDIDELAERFGCAATWAREIAS